MLSRHHWELPTTSDTRSGAFTAELWAPYKQAITNSELVEYIGPVPGRLRKTARSLFAHSQFASVDNDELYIAAFLCAADRGVLVAKPAKRERNRRFQISRSTYEKISSLRSETTPTADSILAEAALPIVGGAGVTGVTLRPHSNGTDVNLQVTGVNPQVTGVTDPPTTTVFLNGRLNTFFLINRKPVPIKHEPPYCVANWMVSDATFEHYLNVYFQYNIRPPRHPVNDNTRVAYAIEFTFNQEDAC